MASARALSTNHSHGESLDARDSFRQWSSAEFPPAERRCTFLISHLKLYCWPQCCFKVDLKLFAWKGENESDATGNAERARHTSVRGGVCPPARVFTNCMLQNLRDAPKRGTESLSLGFKQDLEFFIELLPKFNGIRILDKKQLECQDELELDSWLTGCGAYNGSEFYATRFPTAVIEENHCIAHLELLNVVVALKVWRSTWRGRRVRVACDNTNACLAINSGRSRDPYIQSCVRELFRYCAAGDIELRAEHTPGRLLTRADALSRAHTGQIFRDKLCADTELCRATEVRVPADYFRLNNKL